MQQKLRSVFRRSSKSRSSSDSHEKLDNSAHHSEAGPLRADRQRMSLDRRGRTSVGSSAIGYVYTGSSRPVSSIYDDTRQSQAPTRQTTSSNSIPPADPNGGAIANDYKAYLPALSPVDDDHGDEYIALSGDREHEESVADRNIARYSTPINGGYRNTGNSAHNGSAASSPTTPVPTVPTAQVHSRKQSVDTPPSGVGLSSGLTSGLVRNGDKITTNRGLTDGVRLQTGLTVQGQGFEKSSSITPKAGIQPEFEHEKPNTLSSIDDSYSGIRHVTTDGSVHGEETARAKILREDGVADLRNTVDTDGNITWAPAVTHEVIKPHQHEIIQQKIYREIHNYEHFHRIQPVMMTEVLPPRHWIPDPKGEGLIEISADELPARTGKNRWWSICEQSSPYSLQKALPKYRTEPEIIEAGTFMTEQGFERKETIIIHPPTLADLTGYGGPVQAMHFDHKTGESWLGELTTMDKLHELQQELGRAPDAHTFKMDGLDKALPELPLDSTHRSFAPMLHRKPVGSPSAPVQRSDAGCKLNVA